MIWKERKELFTERETVRGTLDWAVVEGMTLPGEHVERLKRLYRPIPVAGGADLVVRVTWDTAVDVDLVVTEPNGQACSYMAMATPSGGWLRYDDADGFGPETYTLVHAPGGQYRVSVRYHRASAGARSTSVTVDVWRWKQTPRQLHQTFNVRLDRPGQQVDVTTVTMPPITTAQR